MRYTLCYGDGMERTVTLRNGHGKQKHGQSFQPVFDSRKRKVAGLWRRGDRYYAQLRVDLGNGTTAPRRLPLEASHLEEAKAELERKRTARRDGKLPQTGHQPWFADFVAEYFQSAAFAEKKPGTQKLECWAIGRWTAHLSMCNQVSRCSLGDEPAEVCLTLERRNAPAA